ncbi:hypothetical protein NUU61_007529 [Penicillium alfredii]|uniref:Major facilitator superfamily (MFS) profile domain-containing protein n=1 Tax=Penicillium alfredii TaxID=1506179 RepID=A0A9W9F353_9EURO|nr:uncharacterized protein NUU61_007529 [Penicillium alfredii]KAJ5092659.1 hypothetical protein NUU61_007529 [Penicillium alfredii]
MQSYLQYRRIYKQLEKQIVVKDERPENVWTSERRYSYRDGRIQSDWIEGEEDEGARRRKEHGNLTPMSGPAFLPRHSTRQHMERDGDVERADYDPEIQPDPQTLNTQETLGGTTNMMLTGVERPADGVADGATDDLAQKDKFIVVTYEGDYDPVDPHNWPFFLRLGYTIIVSLIALTMLWATTIDSTVNASARAVFRTSYELESVPTGVYLIGIGIGGLLMAPISEVIGRNAVYIPSLFLFMLFTMGTGLAKNVGQRIACRFLAGFCGSTPVVAAAGSLVDLWSRIERIYAFSLYSTLAFMGPLVAPTPGSFINQQPVINWRWVDWITIILAGLVLGLVVLFLPETYSPLLLRWKAKQLRRLTGDNRYRAPLEVKKIPFFRRLGHALYRPLIFFATEPIIMVFTVYLSALFIVLYTWISGYVFIYQGIYKFNEGQVGMALLGVAVGVLLGNLFVPLALKFLRKDIRRAHARGKPRPDPEVSLYMAMFGAPAIPISLFWMGWTARPSISFWCPLGASVLFGVGVFCIFVSSFQYVADAFEFHAASALASIHMFRFVAAGVMRVIARIFYDNVGIPWTLTILGLILTALLPVPYVLYWYGPVIRGWSRYSAISS